MRRAVSFYSTLSLDQSVKMDKCVSVNKTRWISTPSWGVGARMLTVASCHMQFFFKKCWCLMFTCVTFSLCVTGCRSFLFSSMLSWRGERGLILLAGFVGSQIEGSAAPQPRHSSETPNKPVRLLSGYSKLDR